MTWPAHRRRRCASTRHRGAWRLLLAVGLTCVGSPVQAWGPIGHRAVGRIAEHHVAPETARAVAELLAPERLAYVGTWADEIRSDPAWAKAEAWHYVDFPAGVTYAASTKNPGGDAIEAIGRFETILADRGASRLERQHALKWLVHLVGDVHQPLHAGTRADHGGNDVLVLWFGAPSNLHSVWDSGLIERTALASSELAEKVDVATPDESRAWQASTVLEWADESRALQEGIYAIGDGRLSFRYEFAHWPTVERRLEQAGVRLAGVLDRALRPATPRSR